MSFFTMPLAFDLTSTFVIGVTLPVATTLLARSPFSTLASFDGSILVPPRVAANTPTAISNTIPSPMLPQIISLRRFFLLLPLPFTTPPVDTAKWRLGAIPLPSPSSTRLNVLLFLKVAATAELYPKLIREGLDYSRAAKSQG